MTVKVLTVVGARPQFIKAAAVSRALSGLDSVKELIVHTGQHQDHNMSEVFFEELGVPDPAYHLGISGGTHGAMTGRMLEGLERVISDEHPDWVLVYGDTNSTIAGSLAAVKLHVPVAHVEAGLRSFNLRMPEEVNRIVTDQISSLLLCPSETAIRNLAAEGRTKGAHLVGDVMYDVSLAFARIAARDSRVLQWLNLHEGGYVLATVHRAENTDDPVRLRSIVHGLAAVAEELPVVLPLHPRTRRAMHSLGCEQELGKVRVTEPMPFLDMVQLEKHAAAILTDSGGVQKEAYFYGVPCITMRGETEWVETVQLGWNRLVDAECEAIVGAFRELQRPSERPAVYGDGRAAEQIARLLNG
jgi:UDP-GlcNAc3NAcA epimerase